MFDIALEQQMNSKSLQSSITWKHHWNNQNKYTKYIKNNHTHTHTHKHFKLIKHLYTKYTHSTLYLICFAAQRKVFTRKTASNNISHAQIFDTTSSMILWLEKTSIKYKKNQNLASKKKSNSQTKEQEKDNHIMIGKLRKF